MLEHLSTHQMLGSAPIKQDSKCHGAEGRAIPPGRDMDVPKGALPPKGPKWSDFTVILRSEGENTGSSISTSTKARRESGGKTATLAGVYNAAACGQLLMIFFFLRWGLRTAEIVRC